MRVLLVLLPDVTVVDPALGQPLGTRAQVEARITDLLPGTKFDTGRGTFRRASYKVTFTIGDGDEPTVIDVEIDREEGLTALKRVVDKTGWRVIDPDGPSLIDVDSSRAAGGLVATGPYEAEETDASSPAGVNEPPSAASTIASAPRPVERPALVPPAARIPRTAASRGVDGVIRSLLATLGVLILLALPVFVVGPSVLTARLSSPNPISGLAWDIVFSAFAAIPLYVAAFVLTAIARTRQFGLAFATGCAAATLLVTLAFASVQTLLVSYLFLRAGTILAVVAGVQIVLIVAAGRALAAVPLTTRHVAAMLVGLLVPVLYAASVSRAVIAHERALLLEPVLAEKRSIALKQTVDGIRDCVEGYAASYPDRGFPLSLEQLGPNGEQCLSAAITAGQDGGYRFTYLAGVPDAAGRVQLYSVCARPTKFPSDGKGTLVASQRSATRIRFGDSRNMSDSYSCVEAYNEAVGAIEHCAVTYAAAHPQSGYPPTLGDMSGCVMTTGSADFTMHSIVKDEHRYTYIAGPPDTRGVVARFEIYGVNRATYADADQVFADETGVVRIAHAPRLATPDDPFEEDDLKAASLSHERNTLPAQELRTRCDAGNEGSCLDLAAYTRALARQRLPRHEAADVDTIVRLYSAACQSGAAPACAALGDFFSDDKVVPFDLVRAAPLFDRACALGSGEACHRLATLLRESLSQTGADAPGRQGRAVQLDQRGCTLRHGESCFALGLFEDSCRFGVAEGCYRLARLKGNDPRLLLKACARVDSPECANLNPVAGLR